MWSCLICPCEGCVAAIGQMSVKLNIAQTQMKRHSEKKKKYFGDPKWKLEVLVVYFQSQNKIYSKDN